jgi:hypothetical protein
MRLLKSPGWFQTMLENFLAQGRIV